MKRAPRALLGPLLMTAALSCTPPEKPAPPPVKPSCAPSSLKRHEVRIPSEQGIEVFVMHIDAPEHLKRGAVVLTHGAGSPSSALWDLQVKDYSLMRKLACAGWDSYALDMRGFGGSTMPKAMSQPADKSGPVVRAQEVMADVAAGVRFAKARSKVAQVDLFGWSWGSLVAGMYASLHPDQVRRLALFAPVYDRKWPTRHKTEKDPAWRSVDRDLFFKYFDEKREERSVLERFVEQMYRFSDGELRLPNGPYRDIYGEDAPIWDASKVRASTLVIRGQADRASRQAHAFQLFEDLKNAKERRFLVLGGGGHFMFRTRRYRALQSALIHFLSEP